MLAQPVPEPLATRACSGWRSSALSRRSMASSLVGTVQPAESAAMAASLSAGQIVQRAGHRQRQRGEARSVLAKDQLG